MGNRHIVMLMALSAAGCSANGGNEVAAGTDHFRCAALIGAADMLMANGTLPSDDDFHKRSLLSAMSHLNAYAIPKNIQEKDAFDAVKAERDRLIAAKSATSILEEAKACL